VRVVLAETPLLRPNETFVSAHFNPLLSTILSTAKPRWLWITHAILLVATRVS
jgi:hypothetical protein